MKAIARFAWLAAALALPSFQADADGVAIKGSQIAGPAQKTQGDDWFARMSNWKLDSAAAYPAWLQSMRAWRVEQLGRIHYNDAQYRRDELLWTQRDFVQPQVMVEDRYLYDPVAQRYTVSRLLDDFTRRYGGVDSVLLWPVYPNIGIDNRNQWDLTRDMPGGTAGLKAMVVEFHKRGVRVFFPTMPWDTGTRDPGMSHAEATARLMADIGADGVNGDTFAGIPLDYRTASDATGHPVALEPELSPSDDAMLAYNQQSWAYWDFPFVPMVSKWKWLEPRHMINVCDRWARDHTDDLQAAFFNGVGFESWENVWGYWNQITPRDGEALRRIATLYRALPDLLVSPDWTPHAPTLRYGVYASVFPGPGLRLWTLVNRNDFDVGEGVLQVEHASGRRYFDLWNGNELTPRVEGEHAILSLPLEPRGFGAVLAEDEGAHVEGLPQLIAAMHLMAGRPLQSYAAEWRALPQHVVGIEPSVPAQQIPAGMVRIPGAEYDFVVKGIEIEGEDLRGIDVQYPWEDSPRRSHYHRLDIKTFYMDRYPVTNAQFKAFLAASHYHPLDDHNFLKHWVLGAPKSDEESRPVTWVSLEDARAYAHWAGKRLPHEWEWQYAAQGADGRLYPWGNNWDAKAVPTPYKGGDMPPPSPVTAHPSGASPYGVEDLVGNVWQWTDEYRDEHTRTAVLRGGSFYQPQHSYWYFPQAYRLDEHGKYLLMAPSKDRAGTLGFRCAQDSQ